jgi:hypothetical protein
MDKNSKSVTSLFIVLALLALAALALSVGNQNRSDNTALLPELKEELSAITGVRISGPGGSLIADIRSSGNGWLMANADNYPADVGKLRSLLTDLANANIIETTTAVAENYARIGVSDMDGDDAQGLLVELDGTAQPIALILGNTSSGNTTFVRGAGNDQSYRVSGSFKPASETNEWLNREVIDIPAISVLSVKIEHADKETVHIEKSGTEYVLRDKPEDRALNSANELNNIAGALNDVRFEAVRSLTALASVEAEPIANISVLTADGLRLSIAANRIDDETWLSFAPAYDTDAVTADTGTAAAEAAAERAQEISARVTGWAYRIPTYKSDWLLKRNEDLLLDAA